MDDTLVCDPRQLDSGEVRIKRVGCADEVPSNGEGRVGDWLLENSELSLVVRDRYRALTLHTGGGTLIDAAPTGWSDRLLEAIPLVDGGWMVAEEMEAWQDEEEVILTIRGTSTPLAFGGSEGQDVEVQYTLRADEHGLILGGHDGLFLLGDRRSEAVGAGLYRSGLRYQTDGALREDLGGAVLVEGERFAAAEWADAHRFAWPDGQRVSGNCPIDAEYAEALVGDEVIARLESDFDTRVPPEVDGLRCVAAGFSPGPLASPGEGLKLWLGDGGAIWVRAAGPDTHDLPVRVTIDGEAYAVPPMGAQIPVAPGRVSVRVDHGPASEPWEGEVLVEGITPLEVALDFSIDTTDWVLVDPYREGAPSIRSRAEPLEDLELAAAAGVGFAVQIAPDEIGKPYVNNWVAGWLRYDAGSWSLSDDVGSIVSWPWTRNSKKSAHGATDWRGLSANGLLAMTDTIKTPRMTIVDVPWLDAAGPPGDWAERPSLLRLEHVDELPLLLDLLDAGVPVGPMGPLAWTPAEGSRPSAAAIQRGLVTLQAVATTGPLLEMSAPEGLGRLVNQVVHLRLSHNREQPIERVELWADGELARTWTPDSERGLVLDVSALVDVEQYLIAVAVGEEHWAITAPIFVD